MPWVKKKTTINESNSYVSYENEKDAKLILTVIHNTANPMLGVRYEASKPDPELFNHLHQAYRFPDIGAKKYVEFSNSMEKKSTFQLQTTDQEEMINCLNIIQQHQSIADIKDDIYKLFNFPEKQILWGEIKRLIKEKKITEATNRINLALQKGYDEILLFVIQEIKFSPLNSELLENIINTIANLNDKSSYFVQANRFAYDNISALEHDPNNLTQFLELKLRFALNANLIRETSIIFHELSGLKGQPPTTDIKGDFETICFLARRNREQLQLINTLQAEIVTLKNDLSKEKTNYLAHKRIWEQRTNELSPNTNVNQNETDEDEITQSASKRQKK